MHANTNDQSAGMFQKIKSSFQEIFGGTNESPQLEAEGGSEKAAAPAGE